MKTTRRAWPQDSTLPPTVMVCINDREENFVQCCGRHGGPDIAAAVRGAIEAGELPATLKTIECFGACSHGPNVRVSPSGSFYQGIQPADIPELITRLKDEIAAKK